MDALSNPESVLCRRLFLRLLGLVYAIAFVSLAVQVQGLIGADGLRPAAELFERAREVLGGVDLLRLPTVFWLGASDGALVGLAWAGAAVSIALIRQQMWRMLGADDPMEAHKVDSRGIYSRGQSADVREGVMSFLEKRPAKFAQTVSKDMPSYFPWWTEREYKSPLRPPS